MSEDPKDIGRKPDGKFAEGNPGGPGRPPGSGISITTEIKKKLAEAPEGSEATYLQLLINKIMAQAIDEGDAQMIKNIWQYLDGMPKQEISIPDGGLFRAEKLVIEVVQGKSVDDGNTGGVQSTSDNEVLP